MVPWLRLQTALVVVSALLAAPAALGADFFVAPHGQAAAQGTITDPWDIETALKHPRAVASGDVIWLRGGVYALERTLASRLRGAEESPIVVRQFPGERATLDCRLVTETAAGTECLLIQSVHTWYWGFEITNSTTVRQTLTVGSTPNPRGLGVQGQGGLGTKLINLVIHDVGTSLFESQRSGIEIYGTIAYNSGWDGPDRSHGPGFYVRNRSDYPQKTIRDNIVFQHYRQGLQGYGSFDNVFSNFLLEGNVFFNNGIGRGGFHRNLMFGNENTDHRDNVFRENFTYFAPGAGAGSNMLGSDAGGCQGLTLLGNVFAHGPSRAAIDVNNCAGLQIAGNLFYGTTSLDRPSGGEEAAGEAFRSAYPANVYYGAGLAEPRGVAVFLRPNRYEQGRAHLIVYNWDRLPSVAVDLGSLALRAGDSYEIRSVQDYYGAGLRGVYRGGAVDVPMEGWKPEPPIGYTAERLPATFPEFGVFVVTWAQGGDAGHSARTRGWDRSGARGAR
jgi:hypothetical protein